MEEDGGQIIRSDDSIEFSASRKIMAEIERLAIELVRGTPAHIRLEIHFNPGKTQAVINAVLLNINK